MFLLTLNALEVCSHELGVVVTECTQKWVTISGEDPAKKVPILIEPDPVNRTISGCPNINVGIAACDKTGVPSQGYSSFLRIDGKPVCLDNLTGPTDGTPGDFVYEVRSAGQNFVECSE